MQILVSIVSVLERIIDKRLTYNKVKQFLYVKKKQ